MIGTFIIAGAILALLAPVLKKFWNGIKDWLNNTAADVVEQTLGYKARKMMLKAVSVADRFFRMVQGRNVETTTSAIYVAKSVGLVSKVSTETYIPADELEHDFLNELRTTSNIMEMEYSR